MTLADFTRENETALQELAALIARLDERSYALPVGSGWTVASQLCHLAFWDQRVAHLVSRWRGGRFELSNLTGLSVDSINQGVQTLARAIPGAAAARLALESADAADSQVAGASPELVDQILGAGLAWVLERYSHRRAHVRQIQEAVERPA
ncbi:MAG: maleylpyruvate isomerase N-terminal domain-containing protein [Bryobacteraceae bacterium]|jgi:mycothiol maleylpyruvate isomerase-like protein